MIYPEAETGQNLFELSLKTSDLSIDKTEILTILGYTSHNIPDHFQDLIDHILDQLADRCTPRAGYRFLNSGITVEPDGLIINGQYFNMGKIVSSQLKSADQAALFISTIGPGMEEWSRNELIHGDPLISFIIDVIASETVEDVTDLMHDHIGEKMRKAGLNMTNRYSPGYCNWSVSEQQKLFSFFPENFIGVRLTDSSLMIPIKSVSGIIGIGKEVKYREYLCDKCGIKDCTYRIKRKSVA